MLTDPKLRRLWARWFQDRLDSHEATDSDVQLTAIRLAADGVWLADLIGIAPDKRAELRITFFNRFTNKASSVRTGLIIHHDLFSDANDSFLLHTVSSAEKAVLDADELHVLTDGLLPRRQPHDSAHG
jgi:hypothetical protein